MYDSLANGGVLHVQVRLFRVDDEELRTVGIWSTIGHGYYPTSSMLYVENVCVCLFCFVLGRNGVKNT